MQIFRDSSMKQQSLDDKIQALTVKETMSKAHMQAHTNKESHEKQPGKKPGPNRAETGLRRLAWADRPSPFWARFDSPFDLAASQDIYSPLAESHERYIRHPPPRSREEKDTIPERRGSRWLTRVPLAGVETLHGRSRRSSRS
jgi:hypothetical protein